MYFTGAGSSWDPIGGGTCNLIDLFSISYYYFLAFRAFFLLFIEEKRK
jgi:hypothetical protein